MSLYIQQLAKLIANQLGRLYRHFGANSDSAAWFLICTSLISQQPMVWYGTGAGQEQSRAIGINSLGVYNKKQVDWEIKLEFMLYR
jgi:hypothetical protein